MSDKAEPASLILRVATLDDAMDILEWRNDVVTRAMSRQSDAVSRDDHLRWFTRALVDPARLLLMGCVAGEKIGMTRFDLLAPGTWEVNINLAPAQRGKGFSHVLLAVSLQTIAERRPQKIVAEIKPANARSRRLFEAHGFRRIEQGETMDRFEFLPTKNRL
jgi:spore coat polysaccharide biosynthesis protein SpsF